MAFRASDTTSELCFHVLAHVPLVGAGTIFDPRYLAWLDAHGDEPADVRAMLRHDGGLVAQALAADDALVQLLPELHRVPDGVRATRGRALAELGPPDVAAPAVLAAMQRADSVAYELLHVMLGLAADAHAHARRFADAIAPALALAADELARASATAGPIADALAGLDVQLSWALGPRGRAFPGRIVVGAPAPWHGGELATALVLALHEHVVRDRCQGDWAARESSALRMLSTWMVDAPPWLRDAHARWLATLDLRQLLSGRCT